MPRRCIHCCLSSAPSISYSYGVILGGAYFLAFWYALKRARRAGLDEQRLADLGIWWWTSTGNAGDPAALMGLMWVVLRRDAAGRVTESRG